MGIRFTTNTWRAPLQLIDSWLPLAPSPRHHTVRSLLPHAVQRFARAGWLARAVDIPPPSAAFPVKERRLPGSPGRGGACAVRVLQAAGASSGSRHDTRLVISGRINDVCDELDRLVELEHQRGKVAS
ncbi:MAG: hypothetical protein MUF44_01890 [Hydrogenophaga sp.]|jgi:hypothetical protein|nr:hypothetical protein [Hydrogenophaga sp.]